MRNSLTNSNRNSPSTIPFIHCSEKLSCPTTSTSTSVVNKRTPRSTHFSVFLHAQRTISSPHHGVLPQSNHLDPFILHLQPKHLLPQCHSRLLSHHHSHPSPSKSTSHLTPPPPPSTSYQPVMDTELDHQDTTMPEFTSVNSPTSLETAEVSPSPSHHPINKLTLHSTKQKPHPPKAPRSRPPMVQRPPRPPRKPKQPRWQDRALRNLSARSQPRLRTQD
jgi:hypothetical protein